MPDGLNPIVQKMIDAGESEENIATVIRHYKQAVPAGDLVTARASSHDISDAPTAPPSRLDAVNAALEPMAHPQTAGDFSGLLVPSGVSLGGVGDFAKELASRGYNAVKTAGAETAGIRGAATLPVRVFQKFKDALPSTNAAESEKFLGPTRGAPYKPAAPVINAGADLIDRNLPAVKSPSLPVGAPTPATAASGLSDADRALLAKKYPGLDPAKVEQQMSGRLQTAPTESPMQAPRAQVGAEVVGRQNGMTTQAVRDATGPIRGEAQGTAAGMPSAPKDRILGKLIDMGPKGQGLPESAREAYAAAGTSDKTRLQVQAYLDALRKVGFAAPLAVPSVRELLMKKLGQESQ